MTRALVGAARDAYIDGWARTAGPLTRRVQAGCVAAMRLARDYPNDPAILEVTLRLGALEGTWALVYDRRERVYRDHAAAVTAAWREFTAAADTRTAVARMLHASNTALEATDPDPGARRDAAAAAMLAMLHALTDTPDVDSAYQQLLDALTTAVQSAQAEGWAGGVAVSAELAGLSGNIDWDRAYADAYARLPAPERDQITSLAHRIITASARDAADQATRLADDGTDPDEIASEISSTLHQRDQPAVSAYLDAALGVAFTVGALNLYRDLAVEQVDFVTAGDDRVCSYCTDAELNNPWPIDKVPMPALHPHCRCTIAPAGSITAADVTDHL